MQVYERAAALVGVGAGGGGGGSATASRGVGERRERGQGGGGSRTEEWGERSARGAAASREQALLQNLSQRREELERGQGDLCEAVREEQEQQQQHVADDEQRIAKEHDARKAGLHVKRAHLEREEAELERRERKLAGQGTP